MQTEILEQKAAQLLAAARTVDVASVTAGGYPRPCVVVPIKTEGFGTLYFSTGASSRKTAQFRENPKAGVCYQDGKNSVTLLGEAAVIEDAAVKKALWQPWMQEHFPLGADDPEYCLIRFQAKEATYWIDGVFMTRVYGEA